MTTTLQPETGNLTFLSRQCSRDWYLPIVFNVSLRLACQELNSQGQFF